MSDFKHEVSIQIRFSDVDLLGHVSNTVYPSYYDFGKQNYIESILGNLNWNEESIVGASTKIDYLKPVFLHNEILVQTKIAKIGTKSLTFEQQVTRKDTKEIMSTCTAVVVCYNPRTQESMVVPDEWRKKITNFEG